MKKLLTIFTLLLCVTGGAWADAIFSYTVQEVPESQTVGLDEKTASGTIGGTCAFNITTADASGNNGYYRTSSSTAAYYLGTNSAYVKLSLKTGNTFKKGDVVNVTFSTASSSAERGYYVRKEQGKSTVQLESAVSKVAKTTNSVTLTADFDGVSDLYIERNGGIYVFSVSVEREYRTEATLSFSNSSASANVGESFTAPTLTVTPSEAASEVAYMSSNTKVATVATDGTVTLVGGGTTTIMASISGSEIYADASASYTLTVTDPTGTNLTVKYALTKGDTFTSGQKVNIMNKGAVAATITYGETGGADFNAASSDTNIDGYTAYTSGNGTNGNKDGGTFYTIVPTYDGTIDVAVNLGSGKAFYILEDGKALEDYNGITKDATYKGTFSFNVNAGSSYKIYASGSKMGFYGFSYSYKTSDKLFTDIKLDLMNGSFLTSEETSVITVGVNESMKRVEADAADAIATITGKFHSNEHGLQNFVAVVPVLGPVKITFGTCAWGGTVTVKNSNGDEVATFNTNTGACYHSNKTANIISTYYTGEATTLTISGGNYVPYFAVEAADPDELPTYATITFAAGEGAGQGPVAVKQEEGTTYTLPGNFTFYKEGYTFSGWNDGTNDYSAGDTYTFTDTDATLTAQYTANTVAIGDEAVTVVWDFQKQNTVEYNFSDGYIVTQKSIGGETIDLPAQITGTANNTGYKDWAMLSTGTTITIPAISGMEIAVVTYWSPSITIGEESGTITGESAPYTWSYTYTGEEATVGIRLGSGNLVQTVTVNYPAVVTSITKTITAAGYATLCSEYPLDFSKTDGLTAYVASKSGTTVTFSPVTAVPAKTGVLLKGDAKEYAINIATTAPAAVSNVLEGVLEDTEVKAGTFVLMNGDSGVGFYKTESAFTVGANTAYLPASVAAASRTFIGFGGETTGVQSVAMSSQPATTGVYTLQGQRVQQPARGLYIVNGKKTIVR